MQLEDIAPIILLALGVIALVRFGSRSRRHAYWKRNGQQRLSRNRLRGTPERAVLDATDQLRVVMAASFKARPLLNKSERRLFAHLDRILAEETPGWRVMGQVALGEILASDHADAFSAINSKRVDLLIVDNECRPLHAVEFQGTGHYRYGNSAAARDAVKKEALRRAGIGYIEIVSGDTPSHVRDVVRKLVGQPIQRPQPR